MTVPKAAGQPAKRPSQSPESPGSWQVSGAPGGRGVLRRREEGGRARGTTAVQQWRLLTRQAPAGSPVITSPAAAATVSSLDSPGGRSAPQRAGRLSAADRGWGQGQTFSLRSFPRPPRATGTPFSVPSRLSFVPFRKKTWRRQSALPLLHAGCGEPFLGSAV